MTLEQSHEQPPPRSAASRSFLILLIIAGLVEGTSTLLLFFVAMPLKYLTEWEHGAATVSLTGAVHGLLFVLLVLLFIAGRWLVPLGRGLVALGVLAAIVPFGPFLIDIKLVRMLRQ